MAPNLNWAKWQENQPEKPKILNNFIKDHSKDFDMVARQLEELDKEMADSIQWDEFRNFKRKSRVVFSFNLCMFILVGISIVGFIFKHFYKNGNERNVENNVIYAIPNPRPRARTLPSVSIPHARIINARVTDEN